ncbi:TPA: hypothetical protein ACU910_007018, partial [Burkholderia contaminans]
MMRNGPRVAGRCRVNAGPGNALRVMIRPRLPCPSRHAAFSHGRSVITDIALAHLAAEHAVLHRVVHE